MEGRREQREDKRDKRVENCMRKAGEELTECFVKGVITISPKVDKFPLLMIKLAV
jgi:hypothetical protein